MGLLRKTSWGEVKLLGSASKNGSYGIILLSFLFSSPSGHEENEFLPITRSCQRPKHKGLPEHSLKPPILWPKMALLSLYTGLSQTFCNYNRTAPKQQQLICVLFCFEIRFCYVPQASLASPVLGWRVCTTTSSLKLTFLILTRSFQYNRGKRNIQKYLQNCYKCLFLLLYVSVRLNFHHSKQSSLADWTQRE